jgi:serine/threonine protein kinase
MSGFIVKRVSCLVQISVAPLKSSIEMIGSIPEDDSQSLSSVQQIDAICDQFELAWFRGERLSIEKIIADSPATLRDALIRELVANEMDLLQRNGESIEISQYKSRFPDLSPSWFEKTLQKVTGLFNACPTDSRKINEETAFEQLRKYLRPSGRDGWLGQLAHYELESILGQGAFGIVIKAFDERLQRVVAIKFMNPDLAATSPPRKRFIREARAAAAIRHENIVCIHAIEEMPLPYIVMEYIPGVTLQQCLDQNGPLEVREFLRIAQQLAAGLAAAHSANLIHRDIKPSNILLESGTDKHAKISDFGLARAVDDASLTSSGLTVGTPMYMAPEQARGEVLDHRADLFSLGSVLYQMASGRPPFRAANTVAMLKRVCEDTPRPIQDVIPETPDWLCTIIARLLEKNPSDRYQTAKEVADLLARCQSELRLNGKVASIGKQERNRSVETQSIRRVALESNASIVQSSGVGKWVLRLHALAQRRSTWLLCGGILAMVALVSLATFRYRESGLADPRISKQEASISSGPNQESKNSNPTVASHVWQSDAPPPAIAPFDAEQARQHQEAWAKYLKMPVEFTNSIGMKFRLVPPGEFMMGSTPEEVEEALKWFVGDKQWHGPIRSEAPQHKVILTNPTYLGITEVTQAEYVKVMSKNPSYFAPNGLGKEEVAGIDTGLHPVELVTWNDAAEFCTKLSKKESLKPFYNRTGDKITELKGTGYRLPTEAEWEFACRGGTATKFWTGDEDDELTNAEWFKKNSEMRTQAVGKGIANPFGLFDMHGNVAEWTQDRWQTTYYGKFKTAPAIDPTGPASPDTMRMTRGGCFAYPSSSLRTVARFPFNPGNFMMACGFRVSLVVNSPRDRQ